VRVVIVGGSVAGLAAAMLFARQGHEVLVLDSDDIAAAPDLDGATRSPWRPGAPHSPQGHGLIALATRVLRERLPDVHSALRSNGVEEIAVAEHMPLSIPDRSPAAGDDELHFLMTRRSTFDWILRRGAGAEPRVTIRQAVSVHGLDLRSDGLPRVRGVLTTAGAVSADLVIDASGRRSALPRWLAEAGARAARTASAECGLVYFTRHFLIRAGARWPKLNRGFAAGGPLPYVTVTLFPSDNGTAQLAIIPLADDAPMKAVRDPRAFVAFARTVPVVAEWLEVLEPITDVYAMGALQNTLRRLVVDGIPVALGVHAIGDALCTTNPTFGRGIALALSQAAVLVDIVTQCGSDLFAQAIAWEDSIANTLLPWYEDQVTQDNERVARLRQAVFGDPPPPSHGDGPLTLREFATAASVDALVWRALLRHNGMLQERSAIFDDPIVAERTRAALAAGAKPPAVAGVPREEALASIARALRSP
jgi:2-polyprenyl-6-methoxyphenol hydroxylase-like FAD-dependent oxidoreductase